MATRSKETLHLTIAAQCISLAMALLVPFTAFAQTETVLHAFGAKGDGQFPWAPLIADSNGDLYGTTFEGGRYLKGTVFKLSPSGGGWSESVLWNFGAPTDGAYPYSGLYRDLIGNLYGATSAGGLLGLGRVFAISYSPALGWYESIIWDFAGGVEGETPNGGVIMDLNGNLYGTTTRGGSHNKGIVYELSRSIRDGWILTVLYNFGDATYDGSVPNAPLILDGQGNLYGTTQNGGMHGWGTAFELSLSDGVWKETMLHSFGEMLDGITPNGTLVVGPGGSLYGITDGGGTHGQGTIYEISNVAGSWGEAVIYNFAGGVDGGIPFGALVLDSNGNLYGTTSVGGTGNNPRGTAYKLTPGFWTKTVLHSFNGGEDGSNPRAGLLVDSSGNLYGATYAGDSGGTVFKIIP